MSRCPGVLAKSCCCHQEDREFLLSRAVLGGPWPIKPGFPENPHPLKTGQGGRDRRRHDGLNFRLPNAELLMLRLKLVRPA